ncbi:D-alanyl-D-alanine carboxypeptidase family protein [Oenococcus sicerae]|uniref:D-alanyl-D-alanine carboxypeptidase family protein n=1 Tax=Oenococcus sicerae TaxID=2203724 RepID=UPI0010BC750A|nr:D-alanyl-D-alanine carboxypeptidase DacA precursor [Oenococcus sicerae]
MKTLQVLAPAALVGELNGDILAVKNPDTRVPIASVTKLLITYQLYDAIKQGTLSWRDRLVTSQRIADFTKSDLVAEIKLSTGESYTVKDALEAFFILSENTFAFVFAEKIFQNIANWQAQTIKLLAKWGINNPVIPNPSGLSNQDLVTYQDPEMTDSYEPLFSAKEVLTMTSHLVNDFPEILALTQKMKFNFVTDRQAYPYLNRFKFLAIPTHKWLGLKTGTSPDTESFVGVVEAKGRRYITVYLAARIEFLEPKGTNCYIESEKMLTDVLG